MTAVTDETGKRYGKLLVLSRAEAKRGGRARWLCRCDCGNETIAIGKNLRSGSRTSCGCVIGSNRLPEGERAFNKLYYRIRRGAGLHGRVWKLTREQVCILTKQPCYYCGKPPSRTIRYWSSEYIYSGIDRMDNDLGYTESNCVPCCTYCNTAKHTKSTEQFIAYRERI